MLAGTRSKLIRCVYFRVKPPVRPIQDWSVATELSLDVDVEEALRVGAPGVTWKTMPPNGFRQLLLREELGVILAAGIVTPRRFVRYRK